MSIDRAGLETVAAKAGAGWVVAGAGVTPLVAASRAAGERWALLLLAAIALMDIVARPPAARTDLDALLLGFYVVAPVGLKLTWLHAATPRAGRGRPRPAGRSTARRARLRGRCDG